MRHVVFFVRRTFHVFLATLALHGGAACYRAVTCERMKDAYADVFLDHGAQFIEHITHVMGDR